MNLQKCCTKISLSIRKQGRTAGHRAAPQAKLQKMENSPTHKTLSPKRQFCLDKALAIPPISTIHINCVGYEVSVSIMYLKLY